MTTTPTRAEFEALAKRVAALEGLPDHAPEQPAPAMPKCPGCGKAMHPPRYNHEKSFWECNRPESEDCTNKPVAVCSACSWAYCAAHLPKPEGARCHGCDDHPHAPGLCAGNPDRHQCDCGDGKTKPTQPPSTAGVTTALERFYALEAKETAGNRSPCFADLAVAFAEEEKRAAVEAATGPLEAMLRQANDNLALAKTAATMREETIARLDGEAKANAQAASELAAKAVDRG